MFSNPPLIAYAILVREPDGYFTHVTAFAATPASASDCVEMMLPHVRILHIRTGPETGLCHKNLPFDA